MDRSRRRLGRLVGAPLRLGVQIGAAALAVHLVLPQLAGLEATGRALARATWWSGAAVLALEGASLVAYGELVLIALRSSGERVARGLVQRTTLAANALGRTLPGGTTTALAAVVNALARGGVDPGRAATALAVSGALSSLILALLLPSAVLLAVLGGDRDRIAVGATVAACGLLGAAFAARPLLRRPTTVGRWAARAAAIVARGPLRGRLHPETVRRVVERGLGQVKALVTDRETLRVAVGWATANWLLDIAALVTVAVVVGPGVPVTALPLAYIVAQLTASLPTTPGGVGVVEGAMTATLIGAAAPVPSATATVLGWRLVSHWLPILVGLAVLPTLAIRGPRGRRWPTRTEGSGS